MTFYIPTKITTFCFFRLIYWPEFLRVILYALFGSFRVNILFFKCMKIIILWFWFMAKRPNLSCRKILQKTFTTDNHTKFDRHQYVLGCTSAPKDRQTPLFQLRRPRNWYNSENLNVNMLARHINISTLIVSEDLKMIKAHYLSVDFIRST